MTAEGATARFPVGAGASDRLEHAMRSVAVTRLAAGVAHDVRNPLNAMALQVAILSDKLADAGDGVSSVAAPHLAAIREQIARVNDVVRRLADVADPAAPLGFLDVGAMLCDVARLYGHEGRRRQVEIACDAAPDAARARCDPARAGRLLLGLFWKCLAETPGGGRLAVHAVAESGEIAVRLEHAPAAPDPDLDFVAEAAAAAAATLGGRLAISGDAGGARYELRLPRDGA